VISSIVSDFSDQVLESRGKSEIPTYQVGFQTNQCIYSYESGDSSKMNKLNWNQNPKNCNLYIFYGQSID
jgi:hypothetical protein